MSMRHHQTTYTSMNEWLQTPGRMVPAAKPVLRSLNDWKSLPTRELDERSPMQETEKQLSPRDADPPSQSDGGFQKIYNNLTNQIAYRWPNPGSPRNREGSIGGTWRHIKEVQCHGGSRTIFVDGLVSVYDSQKFTDRLQAQLSDRPHVKSLYNPLPPVGVTTTHRASFNAYPVLPGVASPKPNNQLQHLGRYLTDHRGYYYKQ